MAIDYKKLFNPDDFNISEDMSEIDEILEFEEILFTISKAIINYRKENHLTQKEFAEKLKVNQTMISKLESGDYNPTFKTIYNISRKLENSSKMFIDILDEIKINLCKIAISKYQVKIKAKETISQNYSLETLRDSNIIKIKFEDEGKECYEKHTSSISNVG
jgi:DNA-binding helix-turn-helix protein